MNSVRPYLAQNRKSIDLRSYIYEVHCFQRGLNNNDSNFRLVFSAFFSVDFLLNLLPFHAGKIYY